MFVGWGLLIKVLTQPVVLETGIVKPENEINPEFDITNTAIIVNWYDSIEELQADNPDEGNVAGLTLCEYIPEANMSFCVLWLVRPVASDDYYAFDTMGHELYHALAGAFHSE